MWRKILLLAVLSALTGTAGANTFDNDHLYVREHSVTVQFDPGGGSVQLNAYCDSADDVLLNGGCYNQDGSAITLTQNYGTPSVDGELPFWHCGWTNPFLAQISTTLVVRAVCAQ